MDGTEVVGPLCLDVPQVAVLLGVSFETAYQACRRGDLRCVRLGGKRFKVPIESVETLLGHQLEPSHLRWASEQVRQMRQRQRSGRVSRKGHEEVGLGLREA